MQVVQYQHKDNGNASGRLIVFLHGFPSIRSKQNREIAAAVTASTGRPAELLLYSGLGFAPGEFSFSGCLAEVTEYFERLFLGGAREIDLVGHSWGGFLSLVIANRFPAQIRKMVLLSPLLFFAPEELVVGGFDAIKTENPELKLSDTRQLVRDFSDVGRRYETDQLIRGLSVNLETLFLQARVDELTPAEFAIAKKENFPRSPLFELVDNDHSFLRDRPRLAEKIASFLDR